MGYKTDTTIGRLYEHANSSFIFGIVFVCHNGSSKFLLKYGETVRHENREGSEDQKP